MKITQNTTLAEIMEKPEAQEVLAKYNVPCLGCPFAQQEITELKIGDVCKMYSINLKNLLNDLNKVYNKK